MTTTIGNKKEADFFGVPVTPETSMHALRRDSEGLLIYSKININSDETIQLSNSEGQAFEGLEEFVRGITASGVVHNSVPVGVDEFGQKANLGKTYQIKIQDPLGTPSFIINDIVTDVIDLVKGATYKFYTTDPSTQGFPLYISTSPVGGDYDNEFLSGVLNSRSSFGGPSSDLNSNTTEPLIFTVPDDAPDVLYLTSGNHTNIYCTIYTNRLDYANLKNRYYDQVRFDDKKLTYFINSDGFLVARYNKDYDY